VQLNNGKMTQTNLSILLNDEWKELTYDCVPFLKRSERNKLAKKLDYSEELIQALFALDHTIASKTMRMQVSVRV